MSIHNHMRISLNQVSFLGYHGMYAEEKKIGNNFIVDLYVDFTPAQNSITHLEDTVDYVTVFELVQKRMANTGNKFFNIYINSANRSSVDKAYDFNMCFNNDEIHVYPMRE